MISGLLEHLHYAWIMSLNPLKAGVPGIPFWMFTFSCYCNVVYNLQVGNWGLKILSKLTEIPSRHWTKTRSHQLQRFLTLVFRVINRDPPEIPFAGGSKTASFTSPSSGAFCWLPLTPLTKSNWFGFLKQILKYVWTLASLTPKV